MSSAEIICGKKLIDKLHCGFVVRYPCSEAEDVCIIMLTCKLHAVFGITKRCTDAFVTVCCDAHSYTRSADKNSAFTFSRKDAFAKLVCIYGIIDGIRRVCSEIYTFITLFGKICDDFTFEKIAGVVGGESNFFILILSPFCVIFSFRLRRTEI